MKVFKQLSIRTNELLKRACTTSKNLCSKCLKKRHHYGLRTLVALICCLYLFYLLKCFLTIPVKDYYINITPLTRDSIVPEIRLTIGNKNILNTYASEYSQDMDSCALKCTIHKWNPHVFDLNWSDVLTNDGRLSKVVYSIYDKYVNDSLYDSSTEERIATCIYNTYQKNTTYGVLDHNNTHSFIYMHMYQCRFSSFPIGYKSVKGVVEYVSRCFQIRRTN